MANHKSAVKRVRQNVKRNAINRSNRGRLRTQIKKLRTAIDGQDKNAGSELLGATVSVIDKAVNKGIIHKNTAARYKSRLTKHVSELAKFPLSRKLDSFLLYPFGSWFFI
jgi:small subunit ribosomal protein S20